MKARWVLPVVVWGLLNVSCDGGDANSDHDSGRPQDDGEVWSADSGSCLLDCENRKCNEHNGCGGLCGCEGGQYCCSDGTCAADAKACGTVDCSDDLGVPFECGPDGEGGSCGECPCHGCEPEETWCYQHTCVEPETLSCAEIYECMLSCTSDYHTCQTVCLGNGTPEARKSRHDFEECASDVVLEGGCPNFDPACIALKTIEHCLHELGQCFQEDGTCQGALDCQADCFGPFTPCALTCMEEASVEANDLYQHVVLCIVEVCGSAANDACITGAMANECQEVILSCADDS